MPIFSTTTSFDRSSGTAGEAILQQDYLPGLRAQLNSDTILRDRLKRAKPHQFMGSQLQMLAHKGRGVTHVIDSGVTDELPPRSKQDFAQLTYDVVSIGHRVAWSKDELMRTRNAPQGAFVEMMATGMDGARDDLGQEINRQYFGDSSGEIAQLTGLADITDTTAIAVQSTRFLRDGEPIVLADGAGVDIVANGPDNTIVAVIDGTNVELSIAVTVTSSDFIYHRRGAAALIHNEDIFGLQAIVATINPGAGNLGNLAVSGNNFWKGGVLDNGGTDRALSSRLMKNALNLASRRGGKPSIGITSDATYLEYGSLIVADKRFPADPFVTLDGGFTGLGFSGVPIIPDKDAPANELVFLTEDDLMIAEPQEATFEDLDGSTLFRVAGFHQFEALLYIFTQLVAKRRNSHVRIIDLREDNQTHNL